MTRKNAQNTYTDESGKFAEGNPGKPKGARHKSTIAVQNLLDSESEALSRKAIDLALEGDTTALRMCLERICPPRKDSPISFKLEPLRSASDAVKAAGDLLTSVSSGEVTPLEGAAVMGLIESFRKTLETQEFEKRIEQLEATK